MPGSTFSAEQAHGPLVVGKSVVNGWALVKRTPIGEGDVLTFKVHQPLDKAAQCRVIHNIKRLRSGVTV